jgi:hypothetical protein
MHLPRNDLFIVILMLSEPVVVISSMATALNIISLNLTIILAVFLYCERKIFLERHFSCFSKFWSFTGNSYYPKNCISSLISNLKAGDVHISVTCLFQQ